MTADEDLVAEDVVHYSPEPIMWYHQDELMGLVEEEPLPEDFADQPPVVGFDDEWSDDEDVDLYEDGEMEDISDVESIDWDDLLDWAIHVDDEWNQSVAPAG